jgi:hypothetical protein
MRMMAVMMGVISGYGIYQPAFASGMAAGRAWFDRVYFFFECG